MWYFYILHGTIFEDLLSWLVLVKPSSLLILFIEHMGFWMQFFHQVPIVLLNYDLRRCYIVVYMAAHSWSCRIGMILLLGLLLKFSCRFRLCWKMCVGGVCWAFQQGGVWNLRLSVSQSPEREWDSHVLNLQRARHTSQVAILKKENNPHMIGKE